MRRLFAGALAGVLLCFSMQLTAFAAAEPALSAAAAVLTDAESGRVLFAKNADERRPIASITKLMTALVAAETLDDFGAEVTIVRADTLTEGSSMYLKVGEVVTAEALLYGLLLASGNDAALALARVCAGDLTTFVRWMNECAARLAMGNTRFTNPNGLPDDAHYSSASDMAKLAAAVLKNERLAAIVSTKSITIGTRTLVNHNKLLSQYEGCIGLKTGFTRAAGRTLVSAAKRDGQTRIAVTLAAPNDWADHAALLDFGFQNFYNNLLARGGKAVGRVAVCGSLLSSVEVVTTRDVFYPLREDEQLHATLTLPKTVQAPVQVGAVAGKLTFFVGESCVGETELVYAQSAPQNAAGATSFAERLENFLQQ